MYEPNALPTSTKALAVEGVSRPRLAKFDDLILLNDSVKEEGKDSGEASFDEVAARERVYTNKR